jgi:FkbM family methyltransferase
MTKSSTLRSFLRSVDPKPAFKRIIKRKRLETFYSQFITPGDLCFDIGANNGNRTDIFAHLGAKVISLEPQPSCLEVLKKKYAKNPNITIVPMAVGKQSGTAEMYISESASTVSTLSTHWIEKTNESGRFSDITWNTTLNVTVVTLDELIKQYGMPSFIKIDVEGFECEVISGLSMAIKNLSFEFSNEMINETIDCIRHLGKIGKCVCNISYGETLKFNTSSWLTSEETLQFLHTGQLKENSNGDIYVKYQ